MRLALKILLAITASLLSLFLTAITVFAIITANTNLQPQKLVDYTKTITVFDDSDQKIEDASAETKRSSARIEDLNEHTKNAFIASEDRNFYSHKGLNYKRMIKAAFKNIAARSFKEGASTISQQLIKNTHLNSDKTITRKLKEIKLTKQLERRYSKDNILEMYLNTIYFGHNCFGIQSAANFYFGKQASDLTLDESATLAGLLSSPNNYSPYKNPQKSEKRRNIVLKNMLDCSFIDEELYEKTVNIPLTVKNEYKDVKMNSYVTAVFDEIEKLEIDPYGLYGQINVKTYLNRNVQNVLDGLSADCNYSYFIRNNSGGVAGYRSDVGEAKRQIGSTAKPILVYAPAIDMKKIDEYTKILDEPIDYGGYKPENYDKKYHGKVSVAESIMYSYNIPAVKTMNTLNLDDVQKYAEKMSIGIKNEDKNLALALGGMSEGLTIQQLCDGYSVFPNGGKFIKSQFIREITDENGKILYKNDKNIAQNVFGQGTCSIMNDILCRTSKQGTAKKLKDFSFDVACKTGTCGNAEGNTDAYAAGYTSDYSFAVWLGDKDNKKLNVTGGRDCCELLKQALQSIYQNSSPDKLDKSTGTESIQIDREEYENNDKILLCDDNCPKLNRLTVKRLDNGTSLPKSTRFSSPTIKKPAIEVKNNQICIQLCQTKYYSYLVKRISGGKNEIIYDGIWKENIVDAPPDGEYEYTVTPYFTSDDKKFLGEEIIMPRIIIRSEKLKDKIPDIAFKDWYNS